ncbi:hypothetical protein BGW80DRAFT_1357241, partial [Lactifluus volemus]
MSSARPTLSPSLIPGCIGRLWDAPNAWPPHQRTVMQALAHSRRRNEVGRSHIYRRM